jgi:hypothetical protein
MMTMLPREAPRRVPWIRPTQRAAGCDPLFPDPPGRPGHRKSPGCTSLSYNTKGDTVLWPTGRKFGHIIQKEVKNFRLVKTTKNLVKATK